MREINKDLFDPRTMMEPEYQGSPRDGNFGFAFNDSNFSDRVLRIEIMAGPSDSKSDGSSGGDGDGDGDGCSSLLDWGARHRKRRRANLKKKEKEKEKDVDNVDVNVVVDDDNHNVDDIDVNVNANLPDEDDDHVVDGADVAVCAEEQVLNQSDADDVLGGENDDEEAVAMVEESLSGEEEANSNDSSWSMECSTVMRVQTLHISSPILAAKSPFFYKLFSNGMKESEQRHVTLRINESEEAALMELLNFMYSNTLTANTATALLDVLMAADKFEVASCMRYCSRMLRNMPMTPESALLYLDLPLMADAVKPLTDAAKQYLADRYKDITKFQEEVLSLPISGIEAVLSSDGLQVASEDAVYDFVLKWLRGQYPKIEERREILATRLARYIRFPYMTCRKLKKALTCPDIDHELSSKLVMEALFFKAEAPHRQRILIAEDSAQTSRRFLERAYKYRPVKVVDFDLPCQQCVVYLDLKREECANLFPSGRVYSQAFHLGGQGFFLSAHCNMDQQSSFHCFGLFLGMQEKGSVSFGVDYEFAARSKPAEDFQSKYKGNYTFTGGKAVGYRNLFGIPWTSFMAEDSLYFINDTLHLRAELTIRH